jgi:hypothetical protein
MNKIMEAVYRSEMPKLNVRIGVFENKITKELHFAVTSVNSVHRVYDARRFKLLETKLVENTEMIWQTMTDEMIKQMEKKDGS